MFAREGYLLIAVAAVLAMLLLVAGVMFGGAWPFALGGLGVLALAFTLNFFRDPERTPPYEASGGRLILAPADGKVLLVEENVHDPLYVQGPAKLVSIFLSPLDVHVNRIPVDGVVEYVNYVPGDYLVAWHPKSSELNERSEIGVRHLGGTKVLFKQIAGAVARRIIYHVKEGDVVSAGDRYGIVKFGSRMDVFTSPDVDLDVDVGQHVRAGETVLGRIAVPQETFERTSDEEAAR